MTVGDGDTIGYDELQNRFPDIEFVNGNELPYNEHHSYSEIEKQTESETHKKMRENSKNYFICAGFDICDQAIGVMNNYTLADFVAVKQDTIIFVECLTEDCTKQEIIDRKMNLLKYGQLCFVFIGGSGYSDYEVTDNYILPEIIDNIPDEIYIILYYYGHYRNYFQPQLNEYTKILTKDNVEVSENNKIIFEIQPKRKYCHISMNIPINIKHENRKYRLHLLPHIDHNLFFKYKRSKSKVGMTVKWPMKFRIEDIEGINAFVEFILNLEEYFSIDCDMGQFEVFKAGLMKK